MLQLVGPRLAVGSVVVFDEYYNYPGWEEHEHRAWREYATSAGLSFDYLGITMDEEQVSLRIPTSPGRGELDQTIAGGEPAAPCQRFLELRLPLLVVAPGCAVLAYITHTVWAVESTQYNNRAPDAMSICHCGSCRPPT